NEIEKFVFDWPRWLFAAGAMAEGGRGDERAQLINENSLKASPSQKMRGFIRGRGEDKVKIYLSMNPANPGRTSEPVVIWRNPTITIRNAERAALPPKSLKSMLAPETLAKLTFQDNDLITRGGGVVELELNLPPKALFIGINTEAALAPESPADTVLRCTISDTLEPSMGTPVVALLAQTSSEAYKQWRAGVLEFARTLPQNSQGEPTPSDRDDIPPPFNNTYNQPERDWFHQRVKYYRTDSFLVEKILDDASRAQLEDAWADLLTSFDYHDVFLSFVSTKYELGLKDAKIDKLDLTTLPAEPRKYAVILLEEYRAARARRNAAEARHVNDAVSLAEKAWRRPLTVAEKQSLQAFYKKTRATTDHDKAVRALLTRVLVSPAFLYRVEAPAKLAGTQPLDNWQLANRLSYFLWSSPPDAELRRAAAASELTKPENLAKQARRMLADPKARRFATEFFGQWLGFYRFDQYRGVDTSRFPEFTQDVKQGMYEEAVAFFDHIVRGNRPVAEMYAADYTFLTPALAKHYGYNKELKAGSEPVKVEGASSFQRGGMLRLGAVLTSTSAPLRTSPVKRGDWMLRRVLGTPTPPPPPDVGSIPADEKAFGGQTLRERLESHKRNPACASCHTRIDPLGFPLERYDAVGRWRNTYADGKPIHDSAQAADMEISGVDGLLKYVQNHDKQVMRNFAYKLVGYALGRTVQGSDQMLINNLADRGMQSSVADLAAEIVSSRQFRYRKEEEEGAKR
ncbi:MAG TPA: DUF1592 domain-containing protein, partial [Bryobacteraceae bacterium]|nr:DUF1592 domain-containing protein [Bryobacteraceae bacterium]